MSLRLKRQIVRPNCFSDISVKTAEAQTSRAGKSFRRRQHQTRILTWNVAKRYYLASSYPYRRTAAVSKDSINHQRSMSEKVIVPRTHTDDHHQPQGTKNKTISPTHASKCLEPPVDFCEGMQRLLKAIKSSSSLF